MEATPSLACANKCVFCWRHHKNPVATEWKWKADDPFEIVSEAVRLHVAMINECKGVPGVLEDRWREAHTVRHCALSLVGEPIMSRRPRRIYGLHGISASPPRRRRGPSPWNAGVAATRRNAGVAATRRNAGVAAARRNAGVRRDPTHGTSPRPVSAECPPSRRYPRINEMIGELHRRKISSFLVTNAQFPDAIRTLRPVTQLYVSVDAPNRDALEEVDRPLFKDAWARLRESLVILREKKQRTVARLTLVKGHNADDLAGYAELIALGEPTLVEVKGVTFCGKSDASTLTMENCPWHHEVEAFCKELAAKIASDHPACPAYEIACAHKHSVSVLLARVDQLGGAVIDGQRRWNTWIDYDAFHEKAASDAPFGIADYVAPCPDWALFGAAEDGFDPTDTRLYKKKKNGKSR